MASKAEVICWLIEPMRKNLKGELDELAVDEWVKSFRRYTEEELRGGWSIYFDTTKYKTIPMPAEIHAAIRQYRLKNEKHRAPAVEIKDENPRDRHMRLTPWKAYNPWDDEWYWTRMAKKSALYPEAVQEGFPLSFINWTIKTGTPPTRQDFPVLRKRFEYLQYDAARAAENGLRVVSVGQSMLDRNQSLIDAYLAYAKGQAA